MDKIKDVFLLFQLSKVDYYTLIFLSYIYYLLSGEYLVTRSNWRYRYRVFGASI